MKFREPEGMLDKIIMVSVALLVFGALAGAVIGALENITSTNPVVTAVLPIVPFMFVIGVALALYYGLVRRKAF